MKGLLIAIALALASTLRAQHPVDSVATVGACIAGAGLAVPSAPTMQLRYVSADGTQLHNVRWTSNNPAKLAVDNITGVVTAKATGQGTITAVGTDVNGIPQPKAKFPVIAKAKWTGKEKNPFGIDASKSDSVNRCNRVRITP